MSPTTSSPTTLSPVVSLPPGTFRPTPEPGNMPTTAPSNCGPRVRSEWGAIPATEKSRYVRAILRLHDNGEMSRLAQLHWDYRDMIHGDLVYHNFLLWHRAFVFEFEEVVRGLGGFECFTVPYWNYDFSDRFSRSNPRSVFGRDASHLGVANASDGCIGGAFSQVRIKLPSSGESRCIQRFPTPGLDTLRCSTFMDLTGFGERDYQRFGRTFQRAHGSPHVAVGGAPPTSGVFAGHGSPLDPLFMLHHSNIDRIWALWQACHGDYSFPNGRDEFIPYYRVPFSNFIDSSAIRWQNGEYAVGYAPDQFGNRAVYSANFARLLAQCGTVTPEAFLARPQLGVDEWASQPSPGFVALIPQEVQVDNETLECVDSTNTSRATELYGVLAMYDRLSFQDCASQCTQFYFKRGGRRNCVCTSFVSTNASSAPADPQAAKDFSPSCPGANPRFYALYESPVLPAAGLCFRRAAGQQAILPLTCSESNVSLAPLSSAWLALNNLEAGSGDLCANFTPTNFTLSIRCIQ